MLLKHGKFILIQRSPQFCNVKPLSMVRQVLPQRIPDGTEKLISCASQIFNCTSSKKLLAAGQWKNHCNIQFKNVINISAAIAIIYRDNKHHLSFFQLNQRRLANCLWKQAMMCTDACRV